MHADANSGYTTNVTVTDSNKDNDVAGIVSSVEQYVRVGPYHHQSGQTFYLCQTHCPPREIEYGFSWYNHNNWKEHPTYESNKLIKKRELIFGRETTFYHKRDVGMITIRHTSDMSKYIWNRHTGC